jgi:VanZ family protein
MTSLLRYWVPLMVWMVIIFSASADAQSAQRTSRFLEPFLRWLNPDVSAETIEFVRWAIRKMAHLAEYAVLAWLAWRALRKPRRNDPRPWSWKIAGAALGIVVLYAATDEIHQTFVPNRTGALRDVCIDMLGGTLGLLALWCWHRFRTRRCARNEAQT